MNFKVNLVCVDEGETKVNAVIEVTDIDSSTAFQMMKSLRETPEQIKTVIKTAYDCVGAEQKRQFDVRMQLEREQFEYRKARDEKDDFYKKQAEEYAADRDKLREENRQLKDKMRMMKSGLVTK